MKNHASTNIAILDVSSSEMRDADYSGLSFKFPSIYKRLNGKLFEKETTEVLLFSFVVDVWYDLPK